MKSYNRFKVIEIALGEVGYFEKSKFAYIKDKNVIYRKTSGAGYDNYTKYGYEMHKIYPSVMDFPAPWCDCFVDWCFYKAYGVTTAKSLLGGNFDDYTVASAGMYAKHNALNKAPEVGAQIFFTRNGQASGCYHTGLVIAVSADGKTVTTIEGNTSATGSGIEANGGCVAKKVRNVNAYTLFGHPAYNDGYGTKAYNTKVEEVVKVSKTRYAVKAKNGQTYTLYDVSYGDKGETVRFLQQLLTANGFPCTTDGECGEKTLDALAAYQASVKRTTCGKGTWETLLK